MKRISEIIYGIDGNPEEKLGFLKAFFKKYFPVFSVTIFGLLIVFFLLHVFYNKPYFRAVIIAKDLGKITHVLGRIDSDCSILEIENVQNYVDFLNVEKFAGSEVGCLNLAYPKNWKGPYLMDNPTFQGKPYQIVKTREGVFVLPGNGVKLPNGFVVGKDFTISYDSSIPKMMLRGGPLNYNGQPLAVKLKFRIGDWKTRELKQEEMEEISSVLEEFSAAMPFTHNQTNEYRKAV